jgi:predicted nucleic acid-binding protein
MTHKIIQQKIDNFLPLALQQVLSSYKTHVTNFHDHENITKFSEHHKACKLAISNIEMLLKLHKSYTISSDDQGANILQEMLALSRQRVEENEEKLLTI